MKGKKTILLICMLMMLGEIVSAQKILKLYRGGDKQTHEYRIGEEITFKLKDYDEFYTFPIQDLAEGVMVVNGNLISLSNIAEVKTYKMLGASKVFSRMLYVFSGSWTAFSVVDVTYGQGDWREVGRRAAIVSGTALTTGFLIDRLLRHRVHKMEGRKFLQVVEILPE